MDVENFWSRLSVVKQIEGLLGGDKFRSERFYFRDGTIPVLGLQGFNRVAYHINLAAALEQTLGGKADAIFGNHSEHDECRLWTKAFYQFIRMTAFKNV